MRRKPDPGHNLGRLAAKVPVVALVLLLVACPFATAQSTRDAHSANSPENVAGSRPIPQQSGAAHPFSQWIPSTWQSKEAASDTPSSEFRIPVKQPPAQEAIELDIRDGLVSLVVREALMQDVLATIADSQNINIACSAAPTTPISITLKKVPLDEALTAIVSVCGCTWTQLGNIVHVTDLQTKDLAPDVQGKQLQVFPLSFVSGEDVSQAIKTMLSPVGNAYVTAAQPDDSRRSQESIVVEDIPQYLSRIAQYIHQMDRPPRQVLIQIHVLQVDLEKGCRHGVNFTHLMNISNNTVKLQLHNFANANAPQAFFAEIAGGNLLALLEAIKDYRDTKTLASPKVMAINGQLSRIQIGERLGYRVLSNTQTATLESVEFLDVGVVLEVTPTIAGNDQVMMKINPKVSSGVVEEDTGLPNEKTTEVTTNVIVRDGQGIVIGGLIQEEQLETRSKLAFLGDLYLIGGLFQRRVTSKERKEIIFFLLPKIVNGCEPCDPATALEHERVQTRLFHGPLHENYRPYEPKFPSCYDRPPYPWMQKYHDKIFKPEGDCGYPIPGSYMAEPIAPGAPIIPAESGTTPPVIVPPSTESHNEEELLPGPDTILHDVRRAPRPLIFRPAPRPIIARLPAVETAERR